ncbi:lysozyme inhibitor LprI family protein [Yersinia similis]|uniref:lysozyme inhibitor LprI family protein n=1 Tax=Yersinia similis TaxID=367190 RepID=UPI00119EF2EC|nr:lysozyme inhibitor LprI family protein [Yersinia similis]
MVKQFTSGLIISTFFLAVPGYAASFDCNKAKGYVETSICTNPVLSKLDATLLSVYAKAQAAAPDQEINIRNEQREWLKNSRNTLTSEDALILSYESRIAQLSKANVSIPASAASEAPVSTPD